MSIIAKLNKNGVGNVLKSKISNQFAIGINCNGNELALTGCSISIWDRQYSALAKKFRKSHPPYFFPKKRRERQYEDITKDNQDFVHKVISDKYGYGEETLKTNTAMKPLPSELNEDYTTNTILKTGIKSPLKEVDLRFRTEAAENVEPPKLTEKSLRVGLIARKIGVYPMWDSKTGQRFLSTLLQVTDNHVIKYVPYEKSFYEEVLRKKGYLIVGSESCDPQLFTKEYTNLFAHLPNMPPKLKLSRFLITNDAYIPPGTPLFANHYNVGDFVDITGKTIDRGFQGVMKRWGFAGMPATHGVTKSHRRGGNTGGGGEKGRVWPGTKLPGHMGCMTRTLLAQEIVRINSKYNVIYVRGIGTPGENGSFVTIKDTAIYPKRIKLLEKNTPFPTYYAKIEENESDLDTEIKNVDEVFLDSVHDFISPTLNFDNTPDTLAK